MPQVMTQGMFKQVPVPVMKSVDVPVPTPVARPRREPRRCSATDRGKMPSSRAFGDDAGGRARGEEVDHEEEISQSDAEAVKKVMITRLLPC